MYQEARVVVVAYNRVLFGFGVVPCILLESQEKLWAFHRIKASTGDSWTLWHVQGGCLFLSRSRRPE